MIEMGGPTHGHGILDYIKSQAERTMESRPVYGTPPRPLLQLLIPGSCPAGASALASLVCKALRQNQPSHPPWLLATALITAMESKVDKGGAGTLPVCLSGSCQFLRQNGSLHPLRTGFMVCDQLYLHFTVPSSVSSTDTCSVSCASWGHFIYNTRGALC